VEGVECWLDLAVDDDPLPPGESLFTIRALPLFPLYDPPAPGWDTPPYAFTAGRAQLAAGVEPYDPDRWPVGWTSTPPL